MSRIESLYTIKCALYEHGVFPKHLWHKPLGTYHFTSKLMRAEYESWNDRQWAMIEIRGSSIYQHDKRWGWYPKEVSWIQMSLGSKK